jgi:hypothetical protein
MAEQPTAEIAIRSSMKYRQMASLFQLRLAISEAFAKAGKEIVKEKSAYSTSVCARCGAAIEPGAKLVLECENGHKEDQDVNAAMILLNRQKAMPPSRIPAGRLLNRPQLKTVVRALDED